MHDERPRFYTLKEAAEHLRVDRNTLYKHCQKKLIPSVKFGASIRIPLEIMLRLENGEFQK